MKHLLFPLAALCATMATHAAPPTEALVAKARAALGGETALNAVRALRFEIAVADGEGRSMGSIITEYKAPMKLRELDYTSRSLEIVTAIDGVEGHRVLRNLDTGARRMEIMPAPEVDARRDLVGANLRLLAIPTPDRATVETEAPLKIDDTECATLVYKYKSGITLRRFVNPNTGLLVATRIDLNGKHGELMIDKGEQQVAGVNYPKEIIIRNAEGKTLRKLTISKVEVNPELADGGFATPLF